MTAKTDEDIFKIGHYHDKKENGIVIVIDIYNNNYVYCFLKKLECRKWKIQSYNEAMTYVIKSIEPLEVTMVPYLNGVILTRSEIKKCDNKKLKNIIWMDYNDVEISIPKHIVVEEKYETDGIIYIPYIISSKRPTEREFGYDTFHCPMFAHLTIDPNSERVREKHIVYNSELGLRRPRNSDKHFPLDISQDDIHPP